MSSARLIGISSIALAALVAGACGSAQPSGRGPTATTGPKRLELAATGSSAGASVRGAAPAIFPVRPTRYALDGPLANLGATAPVLRMNAHPVVVADVARFADALGVSGAPVRTATGWEVQNGDATLNVDVSGAAARIAYSRGVPGSVGGVAGPGASGSGVATTPGSAIAIGAPDTPAPPTELTVPRSAPVDVPNAADARAVAQALLDRMGVLAGQTWSTAVTDSGGVAVACPVGVPCPTVTPEVVARTVTFSLVVDGKRVDGIAWSATIGEHRRVQSVYGEWAAPAKLGSYALRPTADVFADLQTGTARYTGPQPMTAYAGPMGADAPADITSPAAPAAPIARAVTVHVTGVSLGLARWDALADGGTVVDLVPTYAFHAHIDGGATYDIVVLALEPSAVTFAKPAPTPEPLSAGATG